MNPGITPTIQNSLQAVEDAFRDSWAALEVALVARSEPGRHPELIFLAEDEYPKVAAAYQELCLHLEETPHQATGLPSLPDTIDSITVPLVDEIQATLDSVRGALTLLFNAHEDVSSETDLGWILRALVKQSLEAVQALDAKTLAINIDRVQASEILLASHLS